MKMINRMKIFRLLPLCLLLFVSCNNEKDRTITLDKSVLLDKIAGGWAGKMVGVTYGAPTEFKYLGKIIEDSIPWEPKKIENAKWEDDLYVQMTLMDVMDRKGRNADAKVFQEFFANSGYKLWHANAQARKNYHDSIFPLMSGHPDYNFHADDIDFQIEADFIGMMCPGLPQLANQWSDKIGHIMNYGDGVYGGAFVAALYTEAYLENDICKIITKALQSLPAESDYYKIIQDVLSFYKENPNDWKAAWQKLQDKWENTDICGVGVPFNIDAKLNGAYIALGLLYGEGDINKTMDIATRCGHDSDCNPSTALGVLGVVKGYHSFPDAYKEVLSNVKDTLFVHTNYTLEKAIYKTLAYIEKNVTDCGGKVSEECIEFKLQESRPLAFEASFPNLVFDKRIAIPKESSCVPQGKWEMQNNVLFSDQAGDEISFEFEGSGIALYGWWIRNGGKADVYVDGVWKRTIDCYYNYGKHEHKNANIYHILNLGKGKHQIKLMVRGEKRPESEGCVIGITEAVIFK